MPLGISSRRAAPVPPPPMPSAMQAAMAQLGALDADCAQNLVTQLLRLATMSTPVLLVSTRAADGTQSQADVTLAPGMMLTSDAAGNVTTAPIPTMPAMRVGDLTLSGTANLVGSTGTVTFSSQMPSADYVLNLTYNGLAGLIRVTAKTTAGFAFSVVNLVNGTLSYEAIQKV